MSSFFFYLFAGTAVLASLSVILARFPLYNVLSLVVVIFSLSCLFSTMQAYFVGMLLLLVYAGAVLVFFLFVVMCLNLHSNSFSAVEKQRYRFLGALIGLAFFSELTLGIKSFLMVHIYGNPSALQGTIEAIGKELFTRYLLPFELTSLLLLIAVFGIVSLAKGALSTVKNQGGDE